jgi:hypothetical protein
LGLRTSVLEEDGVFTLRTYYGAVLRRKFSRICVCGAKYAWNPSDEYIHTIKQGTEGGICNIRYYQYITVVAISDLLVLLNELYHPNVGGWEIIYDLLNHLLGEANKFAGVEMHLGHFRSHVETRIQQSNPGAAGFFCSRSWREFIQSGTAATLTAFPNTVRQPCCDLKVIGGDGTCIGVPIANASSVQPVWRPPLQSTEQHIKWGRLDRCAVGNSGDSTAAERKEARTFIHSATASSVSKDQIRELRDNLDAHSASLPPEIVKVLEIWFNLDSKDLRWSPMRRIIHACAYEDSVIGIIPVQIVPDINQVITVLMNGNQQADDEEMKVLSKLFSTITKYGMGPDIVAAVTCCISEEPKSKFTGQACRLACASLLKYLGILNFYQYAKYAIVNV